MLMLGDPKPCSNLVDKQKPTLVRAKWGGVLHVLAGQPLINSAAQIPPVIEAMRVELACQSLNFSASH